MICDSMVELFEGQAERTPDRVAVSITGAPDRLRYRELQTQSNRLARTLIDFGVETGQIVGVCLERSPRYVTSVLAVLKAGAAFLPLDPRYPRPRLDFMLQDSRASILISDSGLLWNSTAAPRTVLLDKDASLIELQRPDVPPMRIPGDPVAYVAYTSGSSGKPKGVVCPQSGLLNRLAWMSSCFPYQPDEIASQIVSLSFVDSIYEIFGPLLKGVELRVISDQIARRSPLELMRAIGCNQITRIIVVPSVLSLWLDCIGSLDISRFPLRYCFVSGEVFLARLATRFRELLPNARLINFYGASELCHHATWFEVTDLHVSTVPIGRPIANTQVYVLDDQRKPVPDGASGEIYAGGPGMARGYLNQPELTAERFIENPVDTSGSRLFKTGDLGRYLENGDLEYLGRIDQQVKIRGCRVEPAEVEEALAAHPAIKEAVAGAREDENGAQRLVAWVSLHEPGLVSPTDLRTFLQAMVPSYLIPSEFVFLASLPRLANHKVNRRELPDPTRNRTRRNGSGHAPLPGTEQRMAAIWAQLFRGEKFERESDFFELGGDSLLAARLILMVEDSFGAKVPADVLLEFPTLSQFATAIEEKRSSIYPRHLVPIQPFGSRKHFFVFGAGPSIMPLARRLAPDQPVLGIRLDQDDLEWLEQGMSLEEIVRRMLTHLVEFQPRGPYCLGGHSMNGLLAYEAAVQLQAQGQEVTTLILIDTYLASSARDRCPLWQRVWSHFVSFVERISEEGAHAGFRHLVASLRLGWLFARKRLRVRTLSGPAGDPANALAAVLSTAEARYCPRPYHGRITMIEARDQILGRAAGARFGWSYLSKGKLEIRAVPGDHNTILLPPNVDDLAHEIAACLERMCCN